MQRSVKAVNFFGEEISLPKPSGTGSVASDGYEAELMFDEREEAMWGRQAVNMREGQRERDAKNRF